MKWVKTGFKLPDTDRKVLISAFNDIWVGYYKHENKQWYAFGCCPINSDVKYWAERPPLP
jgi:hypothetical protein